MHILTTSTDNQTLKIVPRVSISTAEVVLTDKSERKNISHIDFASSTTDGIATITVRFTGSDQLVEGRYYSLTVRSRFDSSNIFYKGLVFCTDQTDYNKYETGKDDYVVESSYDNEFVII